jgi:two-component system chemotaxis sensor kinase CheA
MSDDFSEFIGEFLGEANEGLERAEQSLLAFDPEAPDSDLIHTIFRAVHSIKGAAKMFGFEELVEFTHRVETELDKWRSGELQADADTIALFLECVDAIREQLDAIAQKQPIDPSKGEALVKRLDALPSGDGSGQEVAETTAPPKPKAQEESAPQALHIVFKPDAELMRRGHDPLRFLDELAWLGELQVRVHDDALPALEDLDPERCYLSWEMELTGDVTEEQIRQVFSNVEQVGELLIESKPAGQGQAAAAEKQAVPAPEPGRTDQLQPATPRQQPAARKEQAARHEPPAQPQAVNRPAAGRAAESAPAESIRVNVDKIDILINLVGELVITQAMLDQIGETIMMQSQQGLEPELVERLREGLSELERNTRDLQDSIMRIRMLPISMVFSRLPRVVRDITAKSGKKVELEIVGEHTEVDKTVLEHIADPLMHLLRNALDHGIETPEQRTAAGKPESGHIIVQAAHRGGNIIIEVGDDGRGIDRGKVLKRAKERGLVDQGCESLTDEQMVQLIFSPGFSTAEKVTEVSGRGVGTDVVQRNIQMLGGTITVTTKEGQGTRFIMQVPLTLAIIEGQFVEIGAERYVIPLVSIMESVQMKAECFKKLAGQSSLYLWRDMYVPVIQLADIFPDEKRKRQARLHQDGEQEHELLVILEANGEYLGLRVDGLLGQQQAVIKSLERNFMRLTGLSGATILSDGSVALILDVVGLMRLSRHERNAQGVAIAKQGV